MQRKATALDVAKRAGVSRSAVSLVLNGRGDGNVAKESQDRIRQAAVDLSYSPNPIALSLRNQRTRMIGIVSDHVVVSAFDGNIIGGADDVARGRGFVTVAMDTEFDADRDESAVETLLDRQVDGLIYVTEGLKPLDVPPGMLRVPSVLANCYDKGPVPALPHVTAARPPTTCWNWATGTSRSWPDRPDPPPRRFALPATARPSPRAAWKSGRTGSAGWAGISTAVSTAP
jgi:LacI family transcriptional regulator